MLLGDNFSYVLSFLYTIIIKVSAFRIQCMLPAVVNVWYGMFVRKIDEAVESVSQGSVPKEHVLIQQVKSSG